MPTLSALNLAECGIAYIDIARAADFAQLRITLRIVLSITQHTTLERLDLRGNQLQESEAYNERQMIIATEEAEDLGDVKSQIIDSAEQITGFIALRPSMRNLVLSDCDLWDTGVKPIFETLIDGDRH